MAMDLSPGERREIEAIVGRQSLNEGQPPTICYNCSEPLTYTPDGAYCLRCASDNREYPHPSC